MAKKGDYRRLYNPVNDHREYEAMKKILFFRKKSQIRKILDSKTSQSAIMELDKILRPIFYSEPGELSREEMNIVYLELLEMEVNNGGFHQYFWNSTGQFTHQTVKALEAAGSILFLGLLKSAIAFFPDGTVPADRGKRQDMLEKIDPEMEVFNSLDTEFYLYKEDWWGLMISHIRENIEAFR